MLTRAVVVSLALVAASWLVRQPLPAGVALTQPLAAVPSRVGTWIGEDAPLDRETLSALGADDYLRRTYTSVGGSAAVPVELYVAYYGSQQQGDAIHSPLNCLPGTGWQPMRRDRVQLSSEGHAFVANRLVVQKERNRQAVLYWYEGRGRHIASEYLNKLLLIVDGIRQNRTDAALVRLTTPVETTTEEAEGRLESFAGAVDPFLTRALALSKQTR